MKLLLVNYEFPPVGGGAAQASLAAAKELVAIGHKVDFLTIDTGFPLSDEQLGGVRVHAVKAYRRGLHDASMRGAASFLSAAALRLPRLAAENRYDLYHYYFGLPTGLLALVPGAHRRKPFVVSLRGSDVPGYDPKLNTMHRAMLPLTRRIWRRAAAVIANSAGLQRLAMESMPGRSIDVIRNGAHLPDLGQARLRADGSVRILTVSRLIERKGVDTLLHAVARLRDSRVCIDVAGEGPDRPRLESIARENGIADRVHFHGFTARDVLARLYREADIFALNSLSESCSMALLDGLAAGLPVVATGVGGTPELVEHGTNGLLVRPGDVDELAAALQQLTCDPLRRRAFGQQARRRAEERHSWRSVALQYSAAFEAAVETRRRTVTHGGIGTSAALPARRIHETR